MLSSGKGGPFIYQKDLKYRKDPKIPERPVNGSIHAWVSAGGGGRLISKFANVLMSIFEYSYNKEKFKDLLFDGSCL